MAIEHIPQGEVVDICPLGEQISKTQTHALFRTEDLELIRMVLPAGKLIKEHRAPGSITVQVIEGEIEFTSLESSKILVAGQLLYLEKGEPHSVRAITDSSFLLTIARSDSKSAR